MPRSISRLIWISLVGLLWAGQAMAQGGATGAISGTILDPSGAVVSGAEVRIVNQDTGALTRTTTTDANGSFTATLLPVGNYAVSVTSSGFQEAKFINVDVRITETTRMEARLRTLAVQEKIEVQAQVQTVETTTATTGEAVESKTIRDLPLATQNFQQLLTLSSGAQSELNASAQLGRGNVLSAPPGEAARDSSCSERQRDPSPIREGDEPRALRCDLERARWTGHHSATSTASFRSCFA